MARTLFPAARVRRWLQIVAAEEDVVIDTSSVFLTIQ
jgi:hypothetical protein